MNKLKIGIIGCGSWGWRYAASLFRTGLAEVKFVHRPKTESFEEVRKVFPNVSVSSNWKYIIRECDAVIISTPPEVRFEIISYSIHKNKPVLAEKPLFLSLIECVELSYILEKSTLPFLVNYIHLFSGAFEAIHDMISRTSHGPLKITSESGNKGPIRNFSALWDWSPHDISMILSLNNLIENELSISAIKHFHTGRETSHQFSLNFKQSKTDADIFVWNSHLPKTRKTTISSKMSDIHYIYNDLKIPKASVEINGFLHHIDYDTSPPLDKICSVFVRSCFFGYRDRRFGMSLSRKVSEIIEIVERGGN